MFPAASVRQQDVCGGERAWVSDKEKHQVGELSRFSALRQRSALAIKPPNFLKQGCKITAVFHSWKSSSTALPASCQRESVERTKPAFPASADSAVLLWLRFQWQPLWGQRLFVLRFCVHTGSRAARSAAVASSATPKAAGAGDARGERSFVLSLHLIYGFCPTCTTAALTDNVTATLQVVSMQKGIVRDSSKGKTTEKERNISPHFTAWSTLPTAYT